MYRVQRAQRDPCEDVSNLPSVQWDILGLEHIRYRLQTEAHKHIGFLTFRRRSQSSLVYNIREVSEPLCQLIKIHTVGRAGWISMPAVQARSRPCNPQNLPGGERREVTPELQSSLLLWPTCSYTHNVHTYILPRSFVCRLREALFPTDFSGDTATCPKPQVQHLQVKDAKA